MIRDTPYGFAERLVDAERQDEQEWRRRGRRGNAMDSASMVAIDADRTWVGAMSGWIPNASTGPLLVGVYTAPSHRGRSAGVTDRMLDAVETWAATHAATLRLTVHEHNHRAQAFYQRRGYDLTGITTAYSLDPGQQELEMIRTLNAR
nr:GNAT family N-acetyltransferase [Arthrobacter bussei]